MKKLKVLLSLITRDNDYQREQASVAEATAQCLGIGLRRLRVRGRGARAHAHPGDVVPADRGAARGSRGRAAGVSAT